MEGCPQGTQVRDAINVISLHDKHGISLEESFTEAWNVWTKVNPLPGVLGRICPHPCESGCNRSTKDGSVAINKIERFLGDWGIEKNSRFQSMKTMQSVQKK